MKIKVSRGAAGIMARATAEGWALCVFPSGGNILTVDFESAESVSMQSTARVVNMWATIRPAVGDVGPTPAEVQGALERCTAALVAEARPVDADDPENDAAEADILRASLRQEAEAE